MKLFAELIEDISFARNENRITQLLITYFETEHNIASRNNVLTLLSGKCPKKTKNSKEYKAWATELTGYPEWLIVRSEQETASYIKTLSLLLPGDEGQIADYSLSYWISAISSLSNATDHEIKSFIKNEICRVDPAQGVLILKLLTGTFRSPISGNTLVKCLSHALKIEPAIASLRLHQGKMGKQLSFEHLEKPVKGEQYEIPMQFPEIIASPNALASLGNNKNFEALGYRDGIEVQLIKYEKALYLWTSDLGIVTDKFPEIINSLSEVKDSFIIYGQLLPADDASSLEALKNRIRKKTVVSNDLKTARAVFSVWEILKFNGISSIKHRGLSRDYFSSFDNIETPKLIDFSSWESLTLSHQKSRLMGFSGIVLQEKDTLNSFYLWKANSYSIKAALIYVELDPIMQTGIKSMTFGLSHEEGFVPIAKITAFSNAVDPAEILGYVKENTIERFGPVRTVRASQVFELHFDTITTSKRRKSGMALSYAVIYKKIGDEVTLADSINALKSLI